MMLPWLQYPTRGDRVEKLIKYENWKLAIKLLSENATR